MGASILSVILGRVVFSTYPWPLGPVARPFGSAQHSETEFYRGFGESETTIFNDGLDLAVAESVLSACYNIASQLDEHVSGCWTGPYLGDGKLDPWYDRVEGVCVSKDPTVGFSNINGQLEPDIQNYRDINGLGNLPFSESHCRIMCTNFVTCTAFSYESQVLNGILRAGVCQFYGYPQATGSGENEENCEETNSCKFCHVKHPREEVFQIYVAYTSKCEECIEIDGTRFVSDGGELEATFEGLRKFPATAFDPIVETGPTEAPTVTNALQGLEERVLALETTTTAAAATSGPITTTTPTTVFSKIYVKPVDRDAVEFGRGLVDISYKTISTTSFTAALRVTFGQIGELSRAFCEVACTRDIQCTGYSTPSTPLGQSQGTGIPPDYPCLLVTPQKTHLGTTAAAVKTLIGTDETMYQKQYDRLDLESFYGSRRSTRWAYVRKSLLTPSNILVSLEGEDGFVTIAECGSRCAADGDCFQAIWISPWQPCYKTPPDTEIFYGSPECPVASDPSVRIDHDGVNDKVEIGTLKCADDDAQVFVSGGVFALVLNLYGYVSIPPTAVNADDLGAQRRFWKDPFVRCDAACQARCGDGAEFLRLVPVRIQDEPPDVVASNTLTISIHDCPNVVEIEVERADPSNNAGLLAVTFTQSALTSLPRLRKFTWLKSGNFVSISLPDNPPILSSCVHYTGADFEVTLDNWGSRVTDHEHGPHTYLGVVAEGVDDAEQVYGFPDDAQTYHCIPCDPDPEAVFSGGRGGNLGNVRIVSHRFFSECPGITEAVAPALLYPSGDVTFFAGEARENTVEAWKYQPRSPYLEKLTIRTTDQIISSDKVLLRTDDDEAGTSKYTLQPCAVANLVVETFRVSNGNHRILDANKFRGCLMESVQIQTEFLLKIMSGAFVDNPNLFRVRLTNRNNNLVSEIEEGAFESPAKITDLFVGGGTTGHINTQLGYISPFVVQNPRTSLGQYVFCQSAYQRPGCFPLAFDADALATAVGVTSAACGPGTFNIGPVVDVVSESDRSLDYLGMTRIEIVRPEDGAEKTVQVPTGRLSTMCHPVGTLPTDSLAEYDGFPEPVALEGSPGDAGGGTGWLPAHIADPPNGLAVWATLLVALGSSAVLFGGVLLIGRK